MSKKNVEPIKPQEKDTPASLIRWRFYLVIFIVFCIFMALVARIAFIQVVEPGNLIKQGDLRSVRAKTLHSARGIISDRNGEPLAVSVPLRLYGPTLLTFLNMVA